MPEPSVKIIFNKMIFNLLLGGRRSQIRGAHRPRVDNQRQNAGFVGQPHFRVLC